MWHGFDAGLNQTRDLICVGKVASVRPFEHSIDVKPLEIGSEVLYFSGYNVYLNPGASETLATGYSREYAYVVNDSALMLALGGGLF